MIETGFIEELISGNKVLTAFVLILLWRWHKEAMTKFDDLTTSINGLTTTTALHAKELELGDKRFERIEERQDGQETEIKKIREKMLTREDIE